MTQVDLQLIVSGTLTLDTTERGQEVHHEIPGGSALYAAAAASQLMPVRIVGTVGSDYPLNALDDLWKRGIDHTTISVVDGPSFRWRARYDASGDSRTTIMRDQGVAAGVLPDVPPCDNHALLLGSTDPRVQLHVLNCLPHAVLVGLDSMAHWWSDHSATLQELLPRATVVFTDEHELALAAHTSDLSAGMDMLLAQGPDLVVVKRASVGALMKRRDGTILHASAVELQRLADPTGAGDAFAGALLAALVTAPERGDEYALRFATATASFAIEAVGTAGLVHIDPQLLMQRMRSVIVSRSESSGTFA